MILNGWKEIAAHLGRGIRTVQRWESVGLPVRRPSGRDRSAVAAFSEDVDEWLRLTSARDRSAHPHAPATTPASANFPPRILLVDDDEKILVANAAALAQDGYDVRTARDGFEALALLRGGIPDLMISDLKMPNMSGFELLGVVRKRFPRIAVITLSREFAPATPPRVIADRHLQKGKTSLADLKQAIRELLAESPIRAQHARFPAATWIPRSTNGYVIMTCSECLRPFSVPVGQLEFDKPATEECPNCGQDVHYSIEPTVAAAEVVPPSVLQESNTRIRAAIDEALKASQELRERVQRAEATSRRTDERIDRTETRMHESESRILRRARRK